MAKESEAEKTLKALLEIADTTEVANQLVAAFQAMIESYKAMKADTLAERAARDEQCKEMLKRIQIAIDGIRNGSDGKIGPKGDKGDKGDRGEDGKTIVGPAGEKGKDGSPDTAEDIRNKLELLEGNERLEMSAIKGLRELLDLLEEKVNKKVVHVPHGGGGGNDGGMKVYNLSSQLNGVLKSFALPAMQEIFYILSTSAPTPAMISSEDFTMDFATMTITFGDDIDASTTLATGQRILICYA